MQRIQSINPDRVAWCCNDRDISVEELAKKVGIAADRLAAIIQGKDGLTFLQLRKLAEFFNRGVLFFLEAGPAKPTKLHSVQFRTLTNQKPDLSPEIRALIERVERHRELYLSLLEDLGEKPPRFEPPQITTTDLKLSAARARQWLGLRDENTFDAYRAAVESRGVLVFRSNGFAGKWQIPKKSEISGFSLYVLRCPVIFVRRLEPESRQTFTLMHELGHVLLHRSSFIDSDADLFSVSGSERDANLFAGHVLAPDERLAMINNSQRPTNATEFDGWLKPFKERWGVSGEVILRRLMEAKRLPQSRYDQYRRLILNRHTAESESGGFRLYRYREPRHIFGWPFVRTVLDALHAEQISLAKASTYLDSLKIKDVHALEQHLADL